MQQSITDKDRKRATYCLRKCPLCKKARKEQKGFTFGLVKRIEGGVCPYCKDYAKVYGHKAHERIA